MRPLTLAGDEGRDREGEPRRPVTQSKKQDHADMVRLPVPRVCLLLVLLPVPGVCRAAPPGSEPGRYFAIEIVDEQTGRGVPMVELQTTNSVRYYTDSGGLVAFFEPGL